MIYLIIKYLHIISAILLFGTGLGSALYKWLADRSRQVEHIAYTNRNVVMADWLITTPTVIFQPLSGWWMAHTIGWSFGSPWLLVSMILYVIAGLCWLPVVYLQIRMRNMADQALLDGTPLPEVYWRYAKIWFVLGIPAFLSMVVVVFLMTVKHAFGVG